MIPPTAALAAAAAVPAAGSGRAQPVLQPGTVIDRFQLVALLHTGGMAQIWQVIEVNHAGDSRLPLVMKRSEERRVGKECA